jgi:glutamate synthase (NADPH) small chain
MGVHQANKLVNSCSLCGLCERVCPEDFAVQDLCLTSRRSMLQRGKMPPSAHKFALQDMRFSTGNRFRLARHAPGRAESVRAFFPGCQLCASSPGTVERVYGHLVDMFPEGTGLMLGCCGAPVFWAGQEAAFGEVCGRLREDRERLGRPELILACSTCYRIFSEQLPRSRSPPPGRSSIPRTCRQGPGWLTSAAARGKRFASCGRRIAWRPSASTVRTPCSPGPGW